MQVAHLQTEMSLQSDGRASAESPSFHCSTMFAKFQASDDFIQRPRPSSKPTPSSFLSPLPKGSMLTAVPGCSPCGGPAANASLMSVAPINIPSTVSTADTVRVSGKIDCEAVMEELDELLASISLKS